MFTNKPCPPSSRCWPNNKEKVNNMNALNVMFNHRPEFENLFNSEFENLLKYNIYSAHKNVRSETTKDGFNIYIIAAGAKKEKIQITLNANNYLRVQYAATPDTLSESFHYSIPLGRVKVTNYSATYEDGIIKISLITGDVKPDTIKIPLA